MMPHLFVVTDVYLWLNVSKYQLHLISVFCAYLFMIICILVLILLSHRYDLGMAYVYEYMLLSWHVGMWALRNLKFRTRLYIMGSVSYLVYIVELTFLLWLWLQDK